MNDVHRALTHLFAKSNPPLKPPSRWMEMEGHVVRYLTQTFSPDGDLSDRGKNAVLWSTAQFIEGILSDWGLSGGFWVGNTRFSNADVHNLLHEREKAMQLFERARKNIAAMKTTPRHKPASTTQTPTPVAFLYIVATRLGYKGDTRPHLLLIGHTTPDHRHWGVPGGLCDRSDSSTLFSAMRELSEELLGMRLNASGVHRLIQRANAIGHLSKLTQTPDKHYTAWMLRVDSAIRFEVEFGLPKRTVAEKYNAPLSKETRGYLWIPLPLNVHRKTRTDPWIVNAPSELQSRPLILRQGVLGSSRLI